MKHFLSNSNEYGRTFSSSNYSDKLFREYYAYPFYKGVTEGGSQALMTAYNAYNGTPCIMHPVLRNIVMKEWGLNGTLLTDGGAFRLLLSDHKRFNNDRAAAAAACIKAGITKFLDEYKDAVYEALHRKLISVEDIEKAIRETSEYLSNLVCWTMQKTILMQPSVSLIPLPHGASRKPKH